MNMDTPSLVSEDGYQAIYSSLPQLPDPPQDLPKPWNFRAWQRWFLVAFFISIFALWGLGALFRIRFLDFGGACISSWGIFLFLGIFLITRFSNRGIREHYTRSANPALARSLKKYRKKNPREAYFSLFVKYLIDHQDYYLVWYVPGIGTTLTRSLAQGAEPLLFNREGKPLDDPELFSKIFLMWSYGLNISPGSLQYKLIKDRNTLKKLGDRHLPNMPRLLELNASLLEDLELSPELKILTSTYPIKHALYYHAVETLEKKIAWADCHGWDSLTQLRYDDFLTYHEANVELVNARMQLIEQYSLGVAESAARRIRETVQTQSGRWIERSQLLDSLEVFSVPLPAGEIHLKKGLDGGWKPPEEILSAYNSRLVYVRQVDEKENLNQEQGGD